MNISLSNSYDIDNIRNCKIKIYCEDPYGSMIDILEKLPNNYFKDLRFFEYIFRSYNGIFSGSKQNKNIISVSSRLMSELGNNYYLYHDHSVKGPEYKKSIEILTNTLIFRKPFKVFLYFKDYDENINPFSGFELFSSVKELGEVIDKMSTCETRFVWRNHDELEKIFESYSDPNRYNEIIKILIILRSKGR